MKKNKQIHERLNKLLEILPKRPRTVLEKLLKNGSVSTYDLGQLGYDQPPRAAQDLKEHGVKLTTTFGKHPKSGARMAIYSLADQKIEDIEKFKGRSAFPKHFRNKLFEAHGSKCNLCGEKCAVGVLQIDHRIPFIIAGQEEQLNIPDYQPLCGSHQRLKSWACEHCPNLLDKKKEVCKECYWAYPESDYKHVGTIHEKRVSISWIGKEEITEYEEISDFAKKNAISIQQAIKMMIKNSRS